MLLQVYHMMAFNKVFIKTSTEQFTINIKIKRIRSNNNYILYTLLYRLLYRLLYSRLFIHLERIVEILKLYMCKYYELFDVS